MTRFDGSVSRSTAAPFGAAAVAGVDTDLFQGEECVAAVWGRARVASSVPAECAAQAVARVAALDPARQVASVSGSFGLAILDGRRNSALLATDRMGTRPLYYRIVDGVLVFGSTLDCINAFPAAVPELDLQAVYDYVYFHMVPGPRTVYAGVRRLLPGEYMSMRGGKVEVGRYWEMRFVEEEERPFAELRADFLAVLRESVRGAAEQGPVGTFLSGGTDSSTVAGLLGEVTGEAARTYSIGFEAEGYDEMEYARLAARHFGTRHHEYYVTPDDVVKAIPAIAAVHDQPFGNSSAVPTYYCARLAREDGISALLGGDGGDELFGGNARYAKQRLYSLYSDLPPFLREGLIEPITFALPEIGPVGKAQRYIRNASQPMPARYENYNLLERLGPASVFTPEFLASVDRAAPLADMTRVYEDAHAHSLINRMLALDLKYTLADNDLPKVARSCELAGLDVRFPMLDDAVVAFSARLAPRLKLRGTRLRYFFKEALRGFLPDAILTKKKHGFGLPFGLWLRTHGPLRALVEADLQSLKRRDILRAEFIDVLLNELVHSHAGYYGTMAWVLMMLEQWFDRRPRRAGPLAPQ